MPPHKCSCPGKVLERASPPSSSGCWCLVNRRSLWTSRTMTPTPLCTQNPAHHHPAVRSKSIEPTADGELEPVATEPLPERVTELRIAPEPEPHMMSDQVREPATEHAPVDEASERKGSEKSPAHCTTAEGELPQDSEVLIDFNTELPCLPSSSGLSSCPDLAMEAVSVCLPGPVCLSHHDHGGHSPIRCTPCHGCWYLYHPRKPWPSQIPIHPPSPASSCHPCFSSTTATSCQPLCSPSAHHLCCGIAVGLPVFIDVVAGGSLASFWVLDSASAPPWLLAPSSLPWSVSPLAPSGSLGPLALPWSVIDHPPPRHSTPTVAPRPSGSVRLLLPSGSTLVLCRYGSTMAFLIPVSISSPWLIGSPSLPRASPPPALPSVSPLESSALPPLWLFPMSHLWTL